MTRRAYFETKVVMNASCKTVTIQSVLYLCAGLTATLAGCMVGPDYAPPETLLSPAWHTELGDGLTVEPTDPRTLATWWTSLNDPQLSSLMERAAMGNLDLKTAKSRIRESRARRSVAQGALFPTLSAAGSATSSRTSTNGGPDTNVEVYSSSFDAAWELDVFGGVRRSNEAAQADLEASKEDLRDGLVSLLAETALNYVEVRSFQARLAAAEASLQTQNESYQLAVW